MAVYNERPDYLNAAVDSILSQTHENIEFLIADDGSNPEKAAQLRSIAARDSRIKLIRQENMGLTKTLNKLVRMAAGKYIARQDSDDISDVRRLAAQVEYMEANPLIKLLGTSCYVIDEEGKTILRQYVDTGYKKIKRSLLNQNRFIHGSVMFSSEVFIKEGLYYEEFKFAEDYELFLRISEKWRVDNIDLPLYYYRINPKSISVARSREQLFMGMVAQEAARMRRAGSNVHWSPEVYTQISAVLKSKPNQAELDVRVALAEGRNCMLAGDFVLAREIFMGAFWRSPRARLLWHAARTLLGKRWLR